MATEIRTAVNVIRHDNHVPPVSLTSRDFPSYRSNTVVLSNVSSATTMSVSFDGSSLFTIKPGGVFSMNFSCQKKYWTQGDGSGSLQVIIGSEE